jgi:hypothetical protein
MKKILMMAVFAGFAALTACGPSAEELAAKEKAIQDSINLVEQMRLEAIAAEEAAAAAAEAERLAAEAAAEAAAAELAAAEAAAKKGTAKPKTVSQPKPEPKVETIGSGKPKMDAEKSKDGGSTIGSGKPKM